MKLRSLSRLSLGIHCFFVCTAVYCHVQEKNDLEEKLVPCIQEHCVLNLRCVFLSLACFFGIA